MSRRFWEIDFFRGIAIVSMVAFHLFFDLGFFSLISLPGWFYWLAYPIASAFIFLAGISVSLSMAKRKNYKIHSIKRGLAIFSLGMVLTAVTWLFSKNLFIVFGILHFLGLALMLSYFIEKFNLAKPLYGIAAIALGSIFFSMTGPYLLFPLGIHPTDFTSLDYFPLFPWLGVFMLGIYFGNQWYPKGERIIKLNHDSDSNAKKFISFLGRNSLLIYLVHQPIIIFLIFAPGILF